MELTFSQLPVIAKTPTKRQGAQGKKINWTPDMLNVLTSRFPREFNKDIANSLGVSWRSVVRKAREMGLEKTEDFHKLTGKERGRRAKKSRTHNPAQMGPGFVIPNSEKHRFKKGHTPATARNPELVKQIHQKRNELIKRERLRIKYGLPRLSNLNLTTL